MIIIIRLSLNAYIGSSECWRELTMIDDAIRCSLRSSMYSRSFISIVNDKPFLKKKNLKKLNFWFGLVQNFI